MQRLKKTAEAKHTTHSYGAFKLIVYASARKEHLVLVRGAIAGQSGVPVRIQSACLPGTALDSADCECKEQLEGSLAMISQRPCGVILYMDEEGRGLGLTTKVQALANKNKGMDTFEAVQALGMRADIRDHKNAASIIKDLGVKSVVLITNNPAKIEAVKSAGVLVSGRISIEVKATSQTRVHLQAKKRAGHLLDQRF